MLVPNQVDGVEDGGLGLVTLVGRRPQDGRLGDGLVSEGNYRGLSIVNDYLSHLLDLTGGVVHRFITRLLRDARVCSLVLVVDGRLHFRLLTLLRRS